MIFGRLNSLPYLWIWASPFYSCTIVYDCSISDKQYIHWLDAAFYAVWSVCTRFAQDFTVYLGLIWYAIKYRCVYCNTFIWHSRHEYLARNKKKKMFDYKCSVLSSKLVIIRWNKRSIPLEVSIENPLGRADNKPTVCHLDWRGSDQHCHARPMA